MQLPFNKVDLPEFDRPMMTTCGVFERSEESNSSAV